MKRTTFNIACLLITLHLSLTVSAQLSPPTATPATPLLLQDHPLVDKIWDARANTFITTVELHEALAKAPYVLLGETHDNVQHHRNQLQILISLTARKRLPALVLEQFDIEYQATISAALNATAATADTVAAAGKFNHKGWQWPQYAPLISHAIDSKLDVAAANLSRAEARKVYSGGLEALGNRFDKNLFSSTWNTTRETLMRDGMVQSHCGQLPPAMAPGMVAAQRARDAVMAQTLAGHASSGAVLIAGRGHVLRNMATPLYLEKLQPKLAVAVVGFIEVEADKFKPADFAELALGAAPVAFDYVWFTAKQSRADPCASMTIKLPATATAPAVAPNIALPKT